MNICETLYIHVDTTDLRLNLPQDSSFYGLSRKLVPLSDKEWEVVDKISRFRTERGFKLH